MIKIVIIILLIIIIIAIIVGINKNIEGFSTRTTTTPQSKIRLQKLPSNMSQISASGNNIWAVGPKYYAYRKDGKIWKLIDNTPLSKISVSGNNVWGINYKYKGKSGYNRNWKIYYRQNVTNTNPNGTEWVPVDGPNLKDISVSGNNVWGISNKHQVYYRKGITNANPTDIEWVPVDGPKYGLTSISVSGNNIWGLFNQTGKYDSKIYYRKGVTNTNPTGTKWISVNGPKYGLTSISVSGNNVWGIQLTQNWKAPGLASNTYYRSCVTENTPGGKEWINLDISNFMTVINRVSGLNTISVSGNNIWYVSPISMVSNKFYNYLVTLPSNFYSSINNKCINK